MAADPFWSNLFAMADPGFTGLPIKIRFPFFDLRLVRYLQAVPPVPWLVRKHLLREAMREILPEPVRRRPKTSLAGDPRQVLAQRRGSDLHAVSLVRAAPGLDRYVDQDRLVAKLTSLGQIDSLACRRRQDDGSARVLALPWVRVERSGRASTGAGKRSECFSDARLQWQPGPLSVRLKRRRTCR